VLKSERIGLSMLATSLAVVAIVAYLFVLDHTKTRVEQVRGQGVAVARVLSAMSWGELVPASGVGGVLQTLRYTHSNEDFAYVAVVDTDGEPHRVETASGVIVPTMSLPADPSSWLGERELSTESGGPVFLEFHAPVLTAGNLEGYVRLGYRKPVMGVDMGTVSYLAQLALVVFLLVPAFYFMLRRETASLRKVSERMDQALGEGALTSVEVKPSDEMNDFIARFNQFVDGAKERIQSLESEHDRMETSSKLLAYRQGKIDAILRTLPDAIMVLDETGVISYANDRLAGMLNVEKGELVGHTPTEFCTDQDLLNYLSPLGNGRQMGFVTDAIQFSPGGDADHVLEVRAYPLFSPRRESELLGTLVVFHDIAEAHAARQSQGEFIAHMAHELKTPLNVLSMYSESLLAEDGEDREYRIEATNVIHDEVERLANLINSMLALTRFELGGVSLERGRVRLVELLQDAFENVSQSGRGRGLDFRIDLPREMSAVNVDKDMLRIAVNNLLTNAIKYNRQGGSVILEAEETAEWVEVRVSDTGVGISAEDQAKIFDKFYRSDDDSIQEQQGHGLGLPLAQQIVRLHHGTLSVSSEPGRGTSFSMRLPKDAANVVQVANA